MSYIINVRPLDGSPPLDDPLQFDYLSDVDEYVVSTTGRDDVRAMPPDGGIIYLDGAVLDVIRFDVQAPA